MKPGPKPIGERAMSAAERAARYRARKTAGKPSAKPRKPVDRRPRPRRWADALDELRHLQQEYADWLASLPESLRASRLANMLREIESLDLDALDLELPRGYGRD